MEMAGIKEAKNLHQTDFETGQMFTAGLDKDDNKVGEKNTRNNANKKK